MCWGQTVFSFLVLVSVVHCLNYSVIIIGAGPAGTAAASKLLENNITDILILEAEDRVGGRVFTTDFGSGHVELGAQWCHGRNNNAVFELVEGLDLLEEAKPIPVLFYSNGEELRPQENQELLTIMTDYNFTLTPPVGVDKNDTMDVYIEKYIKSAKATFINDTENLNLALSAAYFLNSYIRSYDGAFNLSRVAAIGDYYQTDMVDYTWSTTGYKIIFDILTKKFPNSSQSLPFEDKLLLNKEVNKIVWDNDEMVIVEASDGTKYWTKQVIFTPSLGVLKNTSEEMFEPGLPKSKREAIDAAGIDAVLKIHMSFDAKWWDYPESFFVSLIWSLEDMEYLKKNESLNWVVDVFGFIDAVNNENVLSAWMVGDKIPHVESLSNEEVADAMYFVLQKFLGKTFNVTRPAAILKSSWYTNPHFRGTYSYQTLEANNMKPSANVRLAEPLRNKQGELAVLFAGEATHPFHYSTVHGAVETGRIEADRIIKYYKQRAISL